MKTSVSLLFIVISVAALSQNVLKDIFTEIDRIEENFETDNPIWEGKHPEVFPLMDIDKLFLKTNLLKGQLERLESLETDQLSVQEKINREIKILQLRDDISTVQFKRYLITINAEGGRFSSPVFFLSNLPFRTSDDYQSYIDWLPTFAEVVNRENELLKQGMKEGIMVPKVIARNIIDLLEPWVGDLEKNAFYQPALNFPESIDESEKTKFRNEVARILRNDIQPAYNNLKSFLEKKYLKAAPDKVGVLTQANGKEFYENRLRHFTTLNMSPDSVFNLGHQEVARIKSQMNRIIKELDFKGTFQEFIDFLRTDPQFYASTPQELLSRAAWISKRAEGELPKLFSELYELPFTVAPVPDNIAPTYTGGRYVPGDRKNNKPGTYWVNTYNLPSRPLYTLPALSLHEAVPGHHLQIMVAAELEDLPDFRKTYYISAFGEGWGLYSEFLGEEMGIYETPYEWFGRYTYEMWRACRLVVDVGIHYKGWTREEAVKFMADNTALSLHEVNTEIDRYIGWPGQAVSYKIGELTIKSLRKKAEMTLGENFDIQDFHKVILSNGSVPLTVLESEVVQWIDEIQNDN